MRTGSRLLLRLLLVAAIVAVTAAQASASVLQVLTAERGFRAVWRTLEFRNTVGSETVSCAVTMEGSFHGFAVDKVAETPIGHVTRTSLNGCTGGSVTLLTETLPWSLNYDSFSGTLPNIAGVRLRAIGDAFRVRSELATCLGSSEVRNPLYLIGALTREAGGLLEMPTLRMEEAQSLPLTGGFPCELARARIAGTASATVLGGTSRIRVSLVEFTPSVSLTPARVEILSRQIVAERKYTIENSSPARGGPRIRILWISLMDAVRFFVNDTEPCTGRTLDPGVKCEFEVNYNTRFETERPRQTDLAIGWERMRWPAATTIARG